METTREEFEELRKKEPSLEDTIRGFFAGTEVAYDFSSKVIVPLLLGQLKTSPKEQAVIGTYLRMYGWIGSLVALDSVKHLQAVAAAVRSLFELSLDLLLLAKDSTGEATVKYQAFIEVERFRVAGNLETFYVANPPLKKLFDPQKLLGQPGQQGKVNALIQKHWPGSSKRGGPEHWSGISAAARAKKLGPEKEKFYREYYPVLSWHIHPSLVGYAGASKEVLEAASALFHRLGQEMFLESTRICADAVKLTPAIDKHASDTLRNLLEQIKLTPGRVILEDQLKKLRETSAPKNPSPGGR